MQHLKYFCLLKKIPRRFRLFETGYSVALTEHSSFPRCSARPAEVFESAIARDERELHAARADQ